MFPAGSSATFSRRAVIRPLSYGHGSVLSNLREKDNVHWFKADCETGFIFNIHVMGYNRKSKKSAARVYVDPEGARTAGGIIIAKKISSAECHKKYG